MRGYSILGTVLTLLVGATSVQAQYGTPGPYAMPQYYHNNVNRYGSYATPFNAPQTFPASPAYRYYQTPFISNPPRSPVPIEVRTAPAYNPPLANPRYLYGLTGPEPLPQPLPPRVVVPQPAPQPPPPADAPASFRVSVPTADARVWVDDTLTKQTGKERLFHTPTLTAGKVYTYTIRATWMENNREVSAEKKIDVRAGGETPVSLSR